MRIRWKLLIILLSFSLIPIFMLRFYGQRSMQKMGNDLASDTRDVLIRKGGLELTLLVEEHALALRLERQLIEMILRLQTSELEKRFAGAHHPTTFQSSETKTPAEAAQGDSDIPNLRFRITGMGRFMPLVVDYKNQSQKFFNGTENDQKEISSVFSSMVPVFR